MASPENVSLENNNWVAPYAQGYNWSPPINQTANFAGGIVGETAVGEDAWSQAQISQRNLYSNTQSLTNGLSSEISWLVSGSSVGQDGGGTMLNSAETRRRYYRGSTIWFQVHCFFPTGYDYFPDGTGGGGRIKFLRVHTYDSSNNNDGYVDIYFARQSDDAAFAFIYEGNQTGGFINIGTDADLPTQNAWHSFQIAVTLDTVPVDSGGLAKTLFWQDGVLLGEITNRQTLVDPFGYAEDVHLNTYWNGERPQDQSYFADAITVTNITPSTTDAGGNPLIEDLV